MSNIEKNSQLPVFELIPKSHDYKMRGLVLKGKRLLVGRSENCDVCIKNPAISSVHAVIEINANHVQIFDMNSTNGCFINDQKVIVGKVSIGDTIRLANVALELRPYSNIDLPPVLDALDPIAGSASIGIPNIPDNLNRAEVNVNKVTPKIESTDKEDGVPYIIYPLAQDPNAEFSEYIFEDIDTLYPIFKYEIGKSSVEVMILHKDQIYSVDYLPAKNGAYQLEGRLSSKNAVEFPYLGKSHKQQFLEVKNDAVTVYNLPDYEVLHLNDDAVQQVSLKQSAVELASNDILKLSKGDIEIYIRQTSAPPKVKAAPIFRRDKSFKKYLLMCLLIVMLPLLALQQFEVDKELEKDKAPERIATILYKEKLILSKNDAVKKTEKAKKVAQKSPKKVEKPKEKTADKPTPKAEEPKKIAKPTPEPVGKKTAKVEQVVKKAKTNPSKTRARAKRPSKVAAQRPNNSATKSTSSNFKPVRTKSVAKGHVDVFKSADFSSAVSSLVAKGGSFSKSASVSDTSIGDSSSIKVGGGSVDALKSADVASDTGSLTGSTVGKIGDSKGVEGMSAKKSIQTAGIPAETVVLGSMDPDIIRRILREHIPQFRYCYQKELDRSGGDSSGLVHVNFIIGASGHVSKAGIDRSKSSKLTPTVQKCVTNVLYGIRFPRPMGGATVEVSQPINFYPKRI